MEVEVGSQCHAAGTPRLEELIPVAVVIGAGCEPGAENLVRRALWRAGSKPAVELTLGLVSPVASHECLRDAVGPATFERVKRALRAGRRASRNAARVVGE